MVGMLPDLPRLGLVGRDSPTLSEELRQKILEREPEKTWSFSRLSIPSSQEKCQTQEDKKSGCEDFKTEKKDYLYFSLWLLSRDLSGVPGSVCFSHFSLYKVCLDEKWNMWEIKSYHNTSLYLQTITFPATWTFSQTKPFNSLFFILINFSVALMKDKHWEANLYLRLQINISRN